MTRYFDASALAKRYVREAGTTSVRRLLSSGIAATSRLTEVEVTSAIARRAREGRVSPKQRDRILTALQHDVRALALVELTPEIAADARTLLLRYPLRAGDAVQLASCLYLQRQLARPIPFVAYDHRLVTAARAEAVEVLGPRSEAARAVTRTGRSLKRVGGPIPPVPGDDLPSRASPRSRSDRTRRRSGE